ncbi:MAG: hypothetical protein GX883_06040, partial [Firmicutes bacterium]|nr:hypothetical protein [Bacillota bacterium]
MRITKLAKRLGVYFLIVLWGIVLTMPLLTAESTFLYGDVNDDGEVSVTDAVLILRHIVQLPDVELEGESWHAANVNSDNEVAVADVDLILGKIAGLIDFFPAERDLLEAEEAVEKAEESSLPEDVESAQALIDALPPIPPRDALQARLDAVAVESTLTFLVISDGATNHDKVELVQVDNNNVSITGDYYALTEYPASGETPPKTARWIGLSIRIPELANQEVTLTIGTTEYTVTLGSLPGQAEDEFWFYMNPTPGGKNQVLSFTAEDLEGKEYAEDLILAFVDEATTSGPLSIEVASDGQTNHENITIVQENNTVTVTGEYYELEEYQASDGTPPATGRWIGFSIKLLEQDHR